MNDNIAIARLLLSAPSNAARADYGDALTIASVSGHANMVRLLLSYETPPAARADWIEVALLLACAAGHDEVAHALLSDPLAPSANIRDGMALQIACIRGHTRVVRLLINRPTNRPEFTADLLQLVVAKDRYDVLRLLLDGYGEQGDALLEEYFVPVFMSACNSGSIDMVNWLLSSPLHAQWFCALGPCMMYVCMKGPPAVAARILSHVDGDANLVESIAAFAMIDRQWEIVQLLLSRMTSPDRWLTTYFVKSIKSLDPHLIAGMLRCVVQQDDTLSACFARSSEYRCYPHLDLDHLDFDHTAAVELTWSWRDWLVGRSLVHIIYKMPHGVSARRMDIVRLLASELPSDHPLLDAAFTRSILSRQTDAVHVLLDSGAAMTCLNRDRLSTLFTSAVSSSDVGIVQALTPYVPMDRLEASLSARLTTVDVKLTIVAHLGCPAAIQRCFEKFADDPTIMRALRARRRSLCTSATLSNV